MAGIGEDIGKVIEAAAPEVGIPVLAAKVIGAVLIGALLLWVGWKLFFSGHEARQAHDVAAAKAGQLVGGAQGAAGAKAANIVAGGAARETIIHERTNTNYVEITKQPGAGDPVSDQVDAAGRRAVCLRSSAAGLPDCQRLQEAGP